LQKTPAYLPTEPLSRKHDREAFSCGREELDRYLKERARQDQDRQVSVCWILPVNGSPRDIWGYYTLSAYSIRLSDLPEATAKRLPRYPIIPAALLGRLAVSDRFQGQNVGEHLLMDAMRRTLENSQRLGIYALFADAKDERVASFYARYGYIALPSDPLRLFLPMMTIAKLFE
jgi:GNAT superfamily N-acetyltransferase